MPNYEQLEPKKTVKSRKILKMMKEGNGDINYYGWDYLENYGYICYLSNFRFIFDSPEERKRIKVFNHISQLVKTRKPYQIKSHHQKMVMKHKEIDEIITALKLKVYKFLKNNPDCVDNVRKLNREAEEFFLGETDLGNTTSRINSGKKK